MVEDARAFVENEETISIEYLFSRKYAITLDDRTVEFTTKFGPVDLNQEFKLENMVFANKLSLSKMIIWKELPLQRRPTFTEDRPSLTTYKSLTVSILPTHTIK